jgi:GntR family transcriptional regulator, transcriptional repressor for pyruvate dehydrogenase complex
MTSQLDRLKIRRVSQLVATELRAMILHGQFNGMDRLPADLSFADEFGVSKHHFREALRLLEQDGLVKVKPGRNGGIFLTTPDVDVLTRTFSGILARKGTRLKDLMEARLVIEPGAAALATINATDEELANLHVLVERQSAQAVYDSGMNTRFHVALCAAAHNETLLLMMRSIESMIESIDIDARAMVEERTLIEDSVRAHKAILRAMERRDADMVANRVRLHILGWETRLKSTGLDPETYSIADVLQAAEATLRR